MLLFTVLIACNKKPPVTPPQPEPVVEMEYIQLNNTHIQYQSPGLLIDLDKDNRPDVLLEVVRVGDNLLAVDKFQFNVITSSHTFLPVNINEHSPALERLATIPTTNFNGYTWWSSVEITLMEKSLFANGSVVWRGSWLDRNLRYLPVQLLTTNGKHNGWVEITEDRANDRLIVHRAAISRVPGKDIKAGL